MKSKYILILGFIIVYLYSIKVSAQDPVFSQFYNSPTNLNPAFTGNFDAPVITINYRNQWPSINNAYSTYAASYDQHFRKYRSGFGLNLLSDSAGNGSLKTNRISLLYSYTIDVNREYRIKLGIESSFIQSRLDWNKLVFYDNLDPQYGRVSPGGTTYPSAEIQPSDLNKSNIDISTGLLLYSSKFYFGFALKHLNSPNISYNNNITESGIPFRFSVHSGMVYTLKDSYRDKEGSFLSPNIIITKQVDFLQVNAGIYAQLSNLIVGTWVRYAYRNIDAVILATGWKYDIYKIVYSFDYTLSNIGISSGGAHEIGIIINFDKIYPDKSRSIECFEVLR